MFKKNKFGEAEITTIDEVLNAGYSPEIYTAGCATIECDGLSYIRKHPYNISAPRKGDSIILLCCQLTDTGIYIAIKLLESIRSKFPEKKLFIGGCLGQRFDIPIPEGVDRIDVFRGEGPVNKLYLAEDMITSIMSVPFYFLEDWNNINTDEMKKCTEYYYIYTGAGCSNNCTYCNISACKGKHFKNDPFDQRDELEYAKTTGRKVKFMTDTITSQQVKGWYKYIIDANYPVIFHHIEPDVVVECQEELLDLAKRKLLNELYCPIQTIIPETLIDMNRDPIKTLEFYNTLISKFIELGVTVSTGVMIDYKDFPNPDYNELRKKINGDITWSVYWDGKWDEERAKSKLNHYLKYDIESAVTDPNRELYKIENIKNRIQ